MTADDPLTHARTLARLLDSGVRLPGTNFHFGLDPVLGLVPGLGDAAGAALGGYIVLLAARRGAPGSVIARMLLNVAIDVGVGSVPVVGDIFDFVWKSNTKNLALLERSLENPAAAHAASRAVLLATISALAAAGVGALALAWFVISLLRHALG